MIANSPLAWTKRARAATPHDAVLWSEHGQQERFQAVLAVLNLRVYDTVLDFGCGTGAFSDALPAATRYLGYDWAEGMIERARREHRGREFTTRYPTGRFEHVVAIGPFNLPDQWSKQHTFHTLRHLWDTTDCRTLAVSLYAGTDTRNLIYARDELRAEARALGCHATVSSPRWNDLLLVARR